MNTGFFAYAKTKTQISFAVTAKLISAFVFATRIIQFLYYLNPKFQASSHLLWLYSPVCVGNPEDRFSQNEARIIGVKFGIGTKLIWRVSSDIFWISFDIFLA